MTSTEQLTLFSEQKVATKHNYTWHDYSQNEQLVEDLAQQIATKLQQAIENKGQAVLALSGGSTPIPLFQELAKLELAWSKVVVTLVDERWVPMHDELSNGKSIHDHFLIKLNETPKFVPLFTFGPASMCAESSLLSVLLEYCRCTGSTPAKPAEFDVVILGMGGDGHFASFFPDAENVHDLVNPNCERELLTCHSPSSQVARVTWSLPMLLNCDFLALHITGDDKKDVFEKALLDRDATQLPIRAAVFQDRVPLNVYHCAA